MELIKSVFIDWAHQYKKQKTQGQYRAVFTPPVARHNARFPPKSFLVRPVTSKRKPSGQGKKKRVVLKNSFDNHNKVSERKINMAKGEVVWC